MFVTLLPLHAASVYSCVNNVFVYKLFITVCVWMYSNVLFGYSYGGTEN